MFDAYSISIFELTVYGTIAGIRVFGQPYFAKISAICAYLSTRSSMLIQYMCCMLIYNENAKKVCLY